MVAKEFPIGTRVFQQQMIEKQINQPNLSSSGYFGTLMPLYLNSGSPQPPSNPFVRAIALVLTAVLAVLVIAFGFVFFLIFLAIALVGGVFMSWRLRKVSKQMNEAMSQAVKSTQQQSSQSPPKPTTGEVIEGDFEVIDRE